MSLSVYIFQVYYVAIAIDFILRFAWTVTLMPASINPYWGPATAGLSDSAAYEMAFLTIIMGSEVFRRMMWSILRVELEHLALVDKFQTFEYVPIYFQTKETDKADTNQPPSSGVLREILTAAVVIAIVTIVTALW